jgi:NADH-quinone oxidoreductase subunit J
MSLDGAAVLFWSLSALCGIGAAAVVFTRDVTRLALGLGAFFLGVAGFFALYGFGFLALAELFVYVGGVLVLVLFAIMLVHRAQPGAPGLESRHDLLAAIAVTGLFAFIVVSLGPLGPIGSAVAGPSVAALGDLLLGEMLPQFEIAGALLLAALVAVIAVSGGEKR